MTLLSQQAPVHPEQVPVGPAASPRLYLYCEMNRGDAAARCASRWGCGWRHHLQAIHLKLQKQTRPHPDGAAGR